MCNRITLDSLNVTVSLVVSVRPFLRFCVVCIDAPAHQYATVRVNLVVVVEMLRFFDIR